MLTDSKIFNLEYFLKIIKKTNSENFNAVVEWIFQPI